ncbi:MAG: prepilin peptidase [Patescibacteria group bacterium]|nr:prepilin peptidase [Patescibacteria group bacterium]
MMLILTAIIILLGLALGSFSNCLIWRLYKQESIIGRSYCPLCQKKLSWYHNIPVLSFLFLKGRCHFCKQKISWQYPLVELAVTGLFLFFWLAALKFQYLDSESLFLLLQRPNFYLYLLKDLVAAWVMIVIFVFDLRYYLVSNLVVWPATLFFIIINLYLGVIWWHILLAMALAALFFGTQYLLTRGRGLGEGDIWLGLLLGALLPNLNSLIIAILSAYVVGSFVGIALIASGHKSWGSKLPLGVFLALGALGALIWGENILQYYWRLF